eukprot:236906_1
MTLMTDSSDQESSSSQITLSTEEPKASLKSQPPIKAESLHQEQWYIPDPESCSTEYTSDSTEYTSSTNPDLLIPRKSVMTQAFNQNTGEQILKKTNQYESGNMFLFPNRELAMYGYVRQHSNNTISDDIIPLFLQFYHHSILWTIKDYDMDIFYECRHEEIMQGPRFSPINGLICSLTIYPQGHKTAFVEQSTFFLEFHNIATYIQNITIAFNFFIYELKYQCICTKKYNVNCQQKYIFWGDQIPFEKAIEGLKSLHISCSIDIIHIEYTPFSELKHFITWIPPLKDTNFKWKFTDNMVNEFKNDTFCGKYYSDYFQNSCWVLSCRKKNTSMLCTLTLLKLPFEIESVNIHYEITTYFDGKKFRLVGNKCFLYSNDKPSDNCTAAKEIFPCELINNIDELIFFVSIKVISVQN